MNKKFALCVGNNYPGTSAQLSGCVNDSLDWGELLARNDYNVTILNEATLDQTVSALVDLVSDAGHGDRIVFTYSGHGTWIPDRDGDESDGRDEALVMADYQRGGLLLDDTIQSIFSKLKIGSGALIISDSCHSGTVSKFFSRGTPFKQPRFLPPTNLIEGLTSERTLELERRAASKPRQTASLLSGCSDLEFSYDAWFDGRANGALTRAAIDTYHPGISLSAWYQHIRLGLPNADYPQSPELTAAPPYRKYVRAI